ncbi:MAG TPA: head GIN domain-containing protein [Prolixibacteraceae bacterium]|nr:head GIN domain-containing protein [Prolixibacteraceae bacterium]
MYLLRLTSLIFALGLLVSKLFAVPVMPVEQSWDDTDTRTYNVQPFTKIYLEGGFKVILEQGIQSGLRIKTDEDNFKYIDVQSDSESLSLKITKKHFNFDELILYITFKDLEKLEIEGGISLETKGYVDLNDFYLHVEGGASIEMNMKARKVKVIGEGGVKFEFDGIADELDASISGAGHLDAIDLKTKRCDIKIEGVGAGSVYATEILNATISGVGKIRYKGDPQVYKNIEGIGLVSPD